MRRNTDGSVLRQVTSQVRAGRFDVVHVHLFRALMWGRLAARLAGVATVVATEHSLSPAGLERRPATTAVRALYRAAELLGDHTVAVSRSVAQELASLGIRSDRVSVVPNGVDLRAHAFDPGARQRIRRQLGVPPGSRLLGTVGRLDVDKGISALVESVDGLLGDRVHLLIVGAGPLRDWLEAEVARRGLQRYVHITGARSDVPPLMSAMDCLVSASPAETYNLVVVEALACGLPTVHVSAPALVELSDQGNPLARHAPNNGPGLRAAIAAAVREPTGPRIAPASLERLDVATISGQIDDVYRQAARPSRGRPE